MFLIYVIVAIVIVFLLFVATRPNTFRVEREITIKAPAEIIFSYLDNFHQWENWSPWEKIDPNVNRIYSGAERGVGSKYAWVGNNKIGEGNMEIIDIDPHKKLTLIIEFIKPMKARNTIEFVLTGDRNQTTVTQAMFGPHNFMAKLMGIIFNIDKMVGGKFEEGLASLKEQIEAR